MRKAYHPSELPEHLKQAIAEAEMDPRHKCSPESRRILEEASVKYADLLKRLASK